MDTAKELIEELDAILQMEKGTAERKEEVKAELEAIASA
jgi:hypothetical protein